MRKYLIIAGLLILGSVVFSSASGLAQSVRSGDNITVSKSETVDSMLFAAGRNLDIAGTVNGDIYCAGMNVTISGEVKGDIFCAAQTLRVSGKVDGSVKLAGQAVNLSSPSVDKVGIAGQTVTIDSQTDIDQDAIVAGQDLVINGRIGRDLALAGQNILVGDIVARDISGNVEQLTLGENAEVGGNIEYTSVNELDQRQGAEVAGTTERIQPAEDNKQANFSFLPIAALYLFFALIIVSLVLVVLFPRLFSSTNDRITSLPGKTALIGFAGLFFTPIVIGLLFATIVGIPLAILVLLAWFVVMFMSGPAFAYTIGTKLWKNASSPMLVMLVGSAVLIALYIIPIIGFFAIVAAGTLGTGAILSEMFNLAKPTTTKPVKQTKATNKTKKTVSKK